MPACLPGLVHQGNSTIREGGRSGGEDKDGEGKVEEGGGAGFMG